MSIFISWSLPSSRALASLMRRFLAVVIQPSNPWMSERDIEAGDVWDAEIEAHLAEATFGVVCVTAENLTRPWLNYEAGALGNRVCPLLLGLTPGQVPPPLGRFHSKSADENGIWSLVESINNTLDTRLDPATLRDAFDGQWPRLRDGIAAIDLSTANRTRKRDRDEMLEEVLQHARDISARTADVFKRVNLRARVTRLYSVGGLGKLAKAEVVWEGSAILVEVSDRQPNAYVDIYQPRRNWRSEGFAQALQEADTEAGGRPHGEWHLAY